MRVGLIGSVGAVVILATFPNHSSATDCNSFTAIFLAGVDAWPMLQLNSKSPKENEIARWTATGVDGFKCEITQHSNYNWYWCRLSSKDLSEIESIRSELVSDGESCFGDDWQRSSDRDERESRIFTEEIFDNSRLGLEYVVTSSESKNGGIHSLSVSFYVKN
jgi:hypothetical protein